MIDCYTTGHVNMAIGYYAGCFGEEIEDIPYPQPKPGSGPDIDIFGGIVKEFDFENNRFSLFGWKFISFVAFIALDIALVLFFG